VALFQSSIHVFNSFSICSIVELLQ
jgi:hypothetical protein